MTNCEACGEPADPPVIVRGLLDAVGIAHVCWPCLKPVLQRRRLAPPPPSLREELDTIFDPEAAA